MKAVKMNLVYRATIQLGLIAVLLAAPVQNAGAQAQALGKLVALAGKAGAWVTQNWGKASAGVGAGVAGREWACKNVASLNGVARIESCTGFLARYSKAITDEKADSTRLAVYVIEAGNMSATWMENISFFQENVCPVGVDALKICVNHVKVLNEAYLKVTKTPPADKKSGG